MPELAEVKIMGDFINYIALQEKFFEKIEKSPVTKVATDLDILGGSIFSLTAITRGKEMILAFHSVGETLGIRNKKLLVNLGMSGNFAYVRYDSPHFDTVMKHSHLRFKTVRGNYLVLHDMRRFAKWRWTEGWGPNRGYDPLTEFNDFSQHLRFNWRTHKVFNAPLSELLMNQSLFNGIGNYLRAEILYRLGADPFKPATVLTNEQVDELVRLTHVCCEEAYILGGGELKDWVNPTGADKKTFQEWMMCYGKQSSVVDGTGRRFWYDPRWEESVPEKFKKKKEDTKE